MKALALGVAAVAALSATTAIASVQTIGGSFARSCYLAAESRVTSNDAIFGCDRALVEQPLTAEDRVATHVNRGILHMLRGDLARAEADYRRAIAINPAQAEAWLNLGIAKYKAGDTPAALETLGKAIELRPKDEALAYYARGLANEDRGNLNAAYADLRRAQQLRPKWNLPAAELKRYRVVAN